MSNLPESADIVIIGGGVMGASAAFHLAEAGVTNIVLLERNELASGSTVKAAGGVRAQFSDPINIALGARGLDCFEDFPNRPGQEIDLHQPGYLYLATTPEQVEAFKQSVALQNEQGVPTQLLTAQEAQELSPSLDIEGVLIASFHNRDGYCSPDSVTRGYAAAAKRMGATIREGVSALGIERDGDTITAVVTDQGTIKTSTVICAAGAWSKEVGSWVDVDLPVEPLRRQILVTEPLPENLKELFPENMPMTIDATSTFYFHREGPAILLGMSYKAETFGFKEEFSDEWEEELYNAMEARCPALLDVGVAHRWAGYYEVTPDHNAVIGEAKNTSRFLYATGFSGHGFLQGPAVGEVLRDMYLGQTPFVDVTPMSAERFASGSGRAELNII